MGPAVNPSIFQFPSWQYMSYDFWLQAVETSMGGRLAGLGFRLSWATSEGTTSVKPLDWILFFLL